MLTKEKSNGTAVKTDKKAAFIHNNPVNKETPKASTEVKTEAPKTEKEKPNTEVPKTEVKQDNVQATHEQPKAERKLETEQPKAEPKADIKPEPVKPVMNLDSTVKVVLELNRKIQHRNNLNTIIANLDAFEVKQEEEAEETGGNSFQNCELTIKDDKGRTFTTKNPALIQNTAQYINYMCVNKRAEIEAGIIIPA